jgi:putative hydrolase of the HAD superfamily
MCKEVAILVDADNTLWDTNRVYADAQEHLLNRVEEETGHEASKSMDRLQYVRQYDQTIAKHHHAGFRYPPELLCRALALGLRGIEPEEAYKVAWAAMSESGGLDTHIADGIQREFLEMLSRRPELRTGVREGMRLLRERGHSVTVVTEGERLEVVARIAEHDLSDAVGRVIEGRKDVALYRRVAKLLGEKAVFLMVGDQVNRDITPAQEAGMTAALFPSAFISVLTEAEAREKPDFTMTSFAEVAEIVQDLERTGSQVP